MSLKITRSSEKSLSVAPVVKAVKEATNISASTKTFHCYDS